MSEQIYLIMKYVRDEICVNRTPTDIIYSRIPTKLDVSQASRSGLYASLSDCAEEAGEEEAGIFRSFCDGIGKSDADVQRGAFDSLLSHYGQLLSEKREKSKSTSRLFFLCSVFFGAAAVIILL